MAKDQAPRAQHLACGSVIRSRLPAGCLHPGSSGPPSVPRLLGAALEPSLHQGRRTARPRRCSRRRCRRCRVFRPSTGRRICCLRLWRRPTLDHHGRRSPRKYAPVPPRTWAVSPAKPPQPGSAPSVCSLPAAHASACRTHSTFRAWPPHSSHRPGCSLPTATPPSLKPEGQSLTTTTTWWLQLVVSTTASTSRTAGSRCVHLLPLAPSLPLPRDHC